MVRLVARPDLTAASKPEPGTAAPRYRIESAVLCVDFDGTLTPTDSLHECLVLALRLRPATIFRMPFWLLRGRAHVKERLNAIAAEELRADLFPRRQEVLDLIKDARTQGCKVELVSAAHYDLLKQSGNDLGFEAIFGSRDGVNLKGRAKADFLASRHPDGFAYVGDSAADLHVWQAARERFGVALSPRVRRRAQAAGFEIEEVASRRRWLPALIRGMRPHQWAKNLLVFVSLGLAVHNIDAHVLIKFLATFAAFCLLTSGTYLINDLTDLASDRQHPSKRRRPLASCTLPIAAAIPAAILMIATALAGAFIANTMIGATLAVYLALTLAYSFGVKRLTIVDVITVAALFTARIVAGAFAYDTPVSRWIVVFSFFFFGSLALMKRTVETGSLAVRGGSEVAGRGYLARDYPFLMAMGIAFGVGALIVFSLYVSDVITSPAQYHSPDALWVAVGALGFWIMRMWLMTTRGQMNDDPILFAVRDRTSVGLGLLVFLVALLAQIV